MPDYDLVVLGAGNAGQSAANRVARAGKKVAVVDKGPVGGLCSLAGCNPKKVLVRATEVLDEVRRAHEHGIAVGRVGIDWSRVIDRKNRFTEPVPAQTEAGFRKLGIDLVRGSARFVAPDRIVVEGREISASGFVIATGSRPRRVSVPGAEHTRISDDILNLREVPQKLVILGAGVVACEFGFVFARLGSEVTIVARRDRALAEFDRDFLAPVIALGQGLGIRWLWHSQAQSVRREGASLVVEIAGPDGAHPEAVPADFVLNALGRAAAIEDLDLARANVHATEAGVEVDGFLRSPSNPRVFAGGDAHGRFQLSPVASYEGRVIARNFLDGPSHEVDYLTVPRAVFLTPPLAAVGLSEERARQRGLDVDVAHNDMASWKVFAIAGEEAARAKTVIDRASRKLLGAQLHGATAPDMIHMLALAVRCGLTADQLEDMVYAYPTPTSALANAFRSH